jgi:hypothetical protein
MPGAGMATGMQLSKKNFNSKLGTECSFLNFNFKFPTQHFNWLVILLEVIS